MFNLMHDSLRDPSTSNSSIKASTKYKERQRIGKKADAKLWA